MPDRAATSRVIAQLPLADSSAPGDSRTNCRYYLVVTVGGYLLWIAVFEVVGRFASTLSTVDLTLELDRRLPFWPSMVWVYELCYLLPLIPALVIRDGHRLNRMILAFILANVVAFAAYLLVPVAFPHPVPGADRSSRVLAFEYAVDFHPGANHLPSLHVVVAWLVWLACLGQGRGRLWPALLGVLALAISIATLLVRQHILVDVLGGIALALGACVLAGGLYPRLAEGSGPREALARVALRAAVPALVAIGLMLACRAALRGLWP